MALADHARKRLPVSVGIEEILEGARAAVEKAEGGGFAFDRLAPPLKNVVAQMIVDDAGEPIGFVDAAGGAHSLV